MTHTAGPWRVEPDMRTNRVGDMWAEDGFEEYCAGYNIVAEDGTEIVGVEGITDEADTNAKLMAAAPDLLEALKAILRHGELANIDKGGPHWSGGKKPPTMDAWAFPRHMLNAVEAAIAKAEGRS